MLLPFMTDGIAMDRFEYKADVMAFVVDGITTGSYLSLSSMLFIRTSSHTCGRWYFYMFLFRDGLLTLMNIDSFISLERFCSSLPTLLKLLMLVVWRVVVLWSCIGEGTNIQKALTACKYPNRATNRMKLKIDAPKTRQNNEKNRTIYRSHITVPYNEGLSESMKNIGKNYGIQDHFKSGKPLKDELMAPKDKDHMTNKSGIIYRFKCNRLDCDEEYIGERPRTFGERYKEHLKAPSPIHDHSNTTGHTNNINNFSIVGREEQNLSRVIKEAMFIIPQGNNICQ